MGFHYEGGICKPCSIIVPGCARCHPLSGDPTGEENKCYECMGNLLLLSSNNICTLGGKRCGQLFDGCNICTYENCLKCLDGFYIKSSTKECKECGSFHPHCALCTESECSTCEEGTYQNPTTKECSLCSEQMHGCQRCILTEQIFWSCQYCQYSKYSPVIIGNTFYQYCHPYGPCTTYDNFFGCTVCATTYIAPNFIHFPPAQPPSESVRVSRCAECVPGYIDPELSGYCSLCSDLLNFCLYCEKESEKKGVSCKLCLTGYMLNVEAECVEADCSIENCVKCSGSDEYRCEICRTPFALSSKGECAPQSITGCLQSSDAQCLRCSPRFAPSPPQGPILNCVHCLHFDPHAFSCTLTPQGPKQYQLLQCSHGYFLNFEKTKCLNCSQVDANCLICAELENKYATNSLRCVVCIPGYKLSLINGQQFYVESYCQKEGCNIDYCQECEPAVAGEVIKCKRCLPNYVLSPQQSKCISCMSENIICSLCFIQADTESDNMFSPRECYECPGPQLSVNLDRNCPATTHPLDCPWGNAKISCISCLFIQNCDQKSCKLIGEIIYCSICESPYLLAFQHDQFISSENSNYPYLLSQSCISDDLCSYFWDLNSNICFIGTYFFYYLHYSSDYIQRVI